MSMLDLALISSDFPTVFLGPNIGHSPNVKKALFFPNFRGEYSQLPGDKITRKNR